MPIGAYLRAMDLISNLPGDVLSHAFPGMGFKETLKQLQAFDEQAFKALFAGVFKKAPEYILSVVAELTGIPEQELFENEEIGLDGLIEIIDGFRKVNRLGECMKAGAELLKSLKPLQSTGFKG